MMEGTAVYLRYTVHKLIVYVYRFVCMFHYMYDLTPQLNVGVYLWLNGSQHPGFESGRPQPTTNLVLPDGRLHGHRTHKWPQKKNRDRKKIDSRKVTPRWPWKIHYTVVFALKWPWKIFPSLQCTVLYLHSQLSIISHSFLSNSSIIDPPSQLPPSSHSQLPIIVLHHSFP